MVGHGVGGGPLLRVLHEFQSSEPTEAARTKVLYVAEAAAAAGDFVHRCGAPGLPMFACLTGKRHC